SPDGKRVYCTGHHLTAFDLKTGAKLKEYDSAIRCSSVAVSPDGKKVAVAREQGTGAAMIVDADTGKTLAELPLKDLPPSRWGPDITGLAFSPDGKMVAGIVTRFEENKPSILTGIPVGLRLWESATGNPIGAAGPADDVPHTFAFVPDTKLIACLGKGTVIHLWDMDVQKIARTIPLRKGDEPTSEVAVSAEGRR